MRRAEAEKENFMRENTEKSSALATRRGRAPELLIPASSLEVLKTAVAFGADAVYIGGEAYGLRAKAKNFSMEDMREGIAFAHAHGVRVHVTANSPGPRPGSGGDSGSISRSLKDWGRTR